MHRRSFLAASAVSMLPLDALAEPTTMRSRMKLGIVISTNEPEIAFNALRLANYAAGQGDSVRVFLLGKGVELDQIQDERFNAKQQAESLLKAGGTIQACGTCLKLRNSGGSEVCPLSTMKDLYEIVRDSDRLVTL